MQLRGQATARLRSDGNARITIETFIGAEPVHVYGWLHEEDLCQLIDAYTRTLQKARREVEGQAELFRCG